MTAPGTGQGRDLLPLLEVGKSMERLREELRAELEAHSDPQVQVLGRDLPELRYDLFRLVSLPHRGPPVGQ